MRCFSRYKELGLEWKLMAFVTMKRPIDVACSLRRPSILSAADSQVSLSTEPRFLSQDSYINIKTLPNISIKDNSSYVHNDVVLRKNGRHYLNGTTKEYLRQICVLYDKLYIFICQFRDFHRRLISIWHCSISIRSNVTLYYSARTSQPDFDWKPPRKYLLVVDWVDSVKLIRDWC